MNCRECVDILYEFLDRELTPELEREIRDHLEDCRPAASSTISRAVPEFLRAAAARRDATELKSAFCVQLFGGVRWLAR